MRLSPLATILLLFFGLSCASVLGLDEYGGGVPGDEGAPCSTSADCADAENPCAFRKACSEGACAYIAASPGDPCGVVTCEDGQVRDEPSCDDGGTCVPGPVIDNCAPYACDVELAQCHTSCRDHDDCGPGQGCNRPDSEPGTCKPDCCVVHDGEGCGDHDIESCVCEQSALGFCCLIDWSEACVDAAVGCGCSRAM